MSGADVDAFLAECDDVIDDWEGSTDSATWASDGSHEHDSRGHYYGEDQLGTVPLVPFRRRLDTSVQRHNDLTWDAWQQRLIEAMAPAMRNMIEVIEQMTRAQFAFDDFSAAMRTYGQGTRATHSIIDETLGWRDPVSDDTRTLLRQRKPDPIKPPAYLYRARRCQ